VNDEDNIPGSKIQIAQVAPQSPAEQSGVSIGDEIVGVIISGKEQTVTTIQQFQDLTKENAGRPMVIEVKRMGSNDPVKINITPREVAPEGQGLLGVNLAKTSFVRYPIHQAFLLAVKTTGRLIWEILFFIGDLFVKLFSAQKVASDVAGPVGIAVLTGQATRLGLAYLLQFAAMLSINLGVINFLPIPALDGGRVLFLLIEKIKGSPVNQKLEGIIHTTVFIFLISLMVLVTVKDFHTFAILDKIKHLF
jgi:regulator of sigma E protease